MPRKEQQQDTEIQPSCEVVAGKCYKIEIKILLLNLKKTKLKPLGVPGGVTPACLRNLQTRRWMSTRRSSYSRLVCWDCQYGPPGSRRTSCRGGLGEERSTGRGAGACGRAWATPTAPRSRRGISDIQVDSTVAVRCCWWSGSDSGAYRRSAAAPPRAPCATSASGTRSCTTCPLRRASRRWRLRSLRPRTPPAAARPAHTTRDA